MLSISSPNASFLLFPTLLTSHARFHAVPTSSACVTVTGVSGRLEPGTTAPKRGLREIKSLQGSQAKGPSELSHLLMALLWPPSYVAPVAFFRCLAGWKILRAAPACAIPYSNSPQHAPSLWWLGLLQLKIPRAARICNTQYMPAYLTYLNICLHAYLITATNMNHAISSQSAPTGGCSQLPKQRKVPAKR